jgi:hypothetical protein
MRTAEGTMETSVEMFQLSHTAADSRHRATSNNYEAFSHAPIYRCFIAVLSLTLSNSTCVNVFDENGNLDRVGGLRAK